MPKRSNASPAITSLQTKPCLTCAREITPRAALARNWAEVKYCSDACRSQRRARAVLSFDTHAHSSETDLADCLWPRLVLFDAQKQKWYINVEDWVELSLLTIAAQPSRKHTCEEVEAFLLTQCRASHSNSDTEAPAMLEEVLAAPPGLCERVRRAARRCLIFAEGRTEEDEAQRVARRFQAAIQPRGKAFTLKQGSQTLMTLHDVSYAKGPIDIGFA